MTNVQERTPQQIAHSNGVSHAQYNFMMKLARERELPNYPTADERVAEIEAWVLATNPDGRSVSRRIDALMGLPKAATEDVAVNLIPGVYEVDGVVYVVKPNRIGDRLYAKRIHEIGGERLTAADTIVQFEFTYAPGAIYQIRPEHRMPVDRAKELVIRYGKCINCGRKLKAAKSVEQGIGPVCIKAFG